MPYYSPGTSEAHETFSLSGVISPSTIATNQNDYSPAGVETASTVRLTSSGSFNITGLVGGMSGRLLSLHNVGANDLVLKDNDVASTAANRFALTGDVPLPADSVVLIQYDSTSSRWRVVSGGGGTGSGAPTTSQYVTLATDGTLTSERVLTGTTNQVVITDNGAGSTVVLSTPQDIHTGASPSFAGLTVSGTLALTGDISPASIGADQNDYAPTGLSTAATIRLTSSVNVNITGLTGGADGRIVTLHNVGSNRITLSDESTGSSAANRFALTSDVTLFPDSTTLLQYDSTSNRWRAISREQHWPWDRSKVITVGSTGQADYTTISAAITAATAGSTILVQPGIYSEKLVINKSLAIVGIGAPADTYTTGTPPFVVINPTLTTANEKCVEVVDAAAPVVVLENLYLYPQHQLSSGGSYVVHIDPTVSLYVYLNRCVLNTAVVSGAAAGSTALGLLAQGTAPIVEMTSCIIRGEDPSNLLTTTAYVGVNGGGSSVITLKTTYIKSGPNLDGRLSVNGTTAINMAASSVETHVSWSGGAVNFDAASRIGGNVTPYTDSDVQTTMVQRSFGLVDTGGQKSLYKLNLRGITNPLSLGDGNIWYSTSLNKFQARENGATLDLIGSPSGSAGGDLAGNYPNPTVAQASQSFALTGDISPTSIGANQNDYAPTGLSTASTLRLTSSGTFSITGLTGGSDGRLLILHNIGSNNIVLTDEDAGSTAANRFALTSNITLSADSVAILQYDSTTTRWRALSGGGGGGPTGSAGGDLAGTYPAPTVAQASLAFSLTGVSTPSSIGSNQNNYTPTGLSTASRIDLTSSGAFNITGITGGSSGRILMVSNIGSNNLTLTHEDTNSTAANRFAFRGSSNIVLTQYKSIILQWCSSLSRWRSFGTDDQYGTTANTTCQGNDSRLSDSRNPTGSASGDLTGTYPSPTIAATARPLTGAYRAVRVASTANIASLSTLLTIDGITVADGDRILVKNQTTGSQNGIYVAASGAWSLAVDWATGGVVAEMEIGVSEGTAGTHTVWKLTTTGAITVGSTSLTFTQFTGGSANVPGGATTLVQYNNAGVFAGATNLTINAGGYPILGEATSSNPAIPTAGSTLFSKFRAGRRMAAQIGPAGLDYTFQPALFGDKIGWWSALGNTTTVNSFGIAENATGTATARTVAVTNLSTSMRRVGYVSANTSGSSAGTRHNLLQWWMGNAAGLGGFLYVSRFIISATNAQLRWFVGLSGTAAALASANPTTLFNLIGFSIDSTQTTIRWIHNDASGAATAVDLGANFPATTTTAVYEARIFVAPNTTTVNYSLERMDSAFLAEGNVNTNIPPNTTLLSPQHWINNGSTTGQVAIDVISQYIETDY